MPRRTPRLQLLDTVAVAAVLLLRGGAAAADEPHTVQSAAPLVAPAAAPAPDESHPPSAVGPVELPTLRSGLWEYRRTFMPANTSEPQVATIRKCGDPGADMREKTDRLKAKGCEFLPLKHQGERYISSWTCKTPEGPLRFRDVLVVTDANRYVVESESHSPEHVSRQKIDAVRVGECPGVGVSAPMTPTPKAHHRPPVSAPEAKE